MSSSARKKEKHRLKRKEKRHQIHRIQSRTALQRIAAEGGRLECWIMPTDWKQAGMASIRVLGHAPGGRAATAMFLVDFWAVGLKDVFGRGDVPELEFRESNLEPWIEQSGAVRLDEALARRIIAGSVRFGRQNSFRMPPEWEKYIVIFGREILDQIPTADLSDFGIDGGLRYVGTMEFLQKRLSTGVDEFLARRDVQWVMEPDADVAPSIGLSHLPMEEQTDEQKQSLQAIYSTVAEGAQNLAKTAQRWCEAHSVEPIPMIEEAAKLVLFSSIPHLWAKKSGIQRADEKLDRSTLLANMMLSQHPPAERQVLENSVTRLLEVLQQCGEQQPAQQENREQVDDAVADAEHQIA